MMAILIILILNIRSQFSYSRISHIYARSRKVQPTDYSIGVDGECNTEYDGENWRVNHKDQHITARSGRKKENLGVDLVRFLALRPLNAA